MSDSRAKKKARARCVILGICLTCTGTSEGNEGGLDKHWYIIIGSGFESWLLSCASLVTLGKRCLEGEVCHEISRRIQRHWKEKRKKGALRCRGDFL